MTERHVVITPRDPLIARDGRPFSAGSRMKPVDWLYPSVVAGSVRTLLGNALGEGFPPHVCDELKKVEIAGALPVVLPQDGGEQPGQICFPSPRDIAFRDETGDDGEPIRATYAARPAKPEEGEGVDLPHGLWPTMLSLGQDDDEFKPGKIPAFWSSARMVEWLTWPGPRESSSEVAVGAFALETKIPAGGFFEAAMQDERMHVQIQEGLGTADDGMLYSTTGLDLTGLKPARLKSPRKSGEKNRESEDGDVPASQWDRLTLAARVSASGRFDEPAGRLDHLQTVGGERRLVHVATAAGSEHSGYWAPPEGIRHALRNSPKNAEGRPLVRLVLATPGLFTTGWHPDFLVPDASDASLAERDRPLVGIVPETGVRVRLVGACVERWRPISGWSLENGKDKHGKDKRGPKPVRRLVPAGSVYFFEVLDGDPAALVDRWLRTVCLKGDDGQAARDGFGLALWGVWRPHQK